jgi:hypothetical protein
MSSLPISLKFMSGSSCSDLPSLKGYTKSEVRRLHSDLEIQKRFVLVPRPWSVVNGSCHYGYSSGNWVSLHLFIPGDSLVVASHRDANQKWAIRETSHLSVLLLTFPL